MNEAVQLIRTLNQQLSFTPLNSFMCEAVLNEELDVHKDEFNPHAFTSIAQLR